MRNNIVFKFVAVFLCAAALLGAVGSGLGIGALTATGLYEKSFDEIYDSHVMGYAIEFANEALVRYASTELGGCSTQLVDDYYGTGWYYRYFNWGSVGYAVRDPEGNVVYEEALEDQTAVHTYTLDTPAQYMRFLSEMSLEEYEALNPEPTEAEYILYDAIPPEGTYVTNIYVAYADGFAESVGGYPEIGWLAYDEFGRVRFQSNFGELVEYCGVPVTHISFSCGEETPATEDVIIYEASDPDGVGEFIETEGMLVFQSWGDVPVETVPAEAFDVYDDVPPMGTYVYKVDLQLKNTGEIISIDTGDWLGTASRESGTVTLRCRNWADFVFSKPADISYVLMVGEESRLLYEAGEPNGAAIVGTFAYDENGELVFTAVDPQSAVPAAAAEMPEEAESAVPVEKPEGMDSTDPTYGEESTGATEETATQETLGETVPETTGETIPETTGETVPETIEETVPETTEALSVLSSLDTDAGGLPIGDTMEAYRSVDVEQTEGIQYYNYYNHELGQVMRVEYTMEPLENYTVEVQLGSRAMEQEYEWQLLALAYGLQDTLPMVLGISLLVFAIMAVYLCCAAGRKPGTEMVHAAGLNCIPLDLYLGLVIGGVVLLAFLCMAVAEFLLPSDARTGLAALAALAFGASLLVVGFCFACAAQFKTSGGYWWRNSLCGRCLCLAGRFLCWGLKACEWIDEKVPPVLGRIFRKLWAIAKAVFLKAWALVVWAWHLAGRISQVLFQWVKKTWSWGWREFRRFCGMLPLTWQWLLGGAVLLVLCVLAWANRNDGWGFVWLLLGFGLILFASHCFGTLHEATKRMSKGNLDEKVDDKFMVGCFQEFAGDLNSLAGVAVIAAQKQLKSERMKTELITNVSHDIKTPLTSIINYVDLLQKPHTEAEQEQYLEVLERQSQRLKKLIEDLMEMSKASTGNLAVDITKVDAAEAINQALGEFADKLDKAQLTPVFRQPDDPIAMMADGRLVWRVMSNLLGNAVKYALPGTRLYLDLMEMEGKVIISMKNISREELNVNADELLERFVRGDVSRNTEGSGLGLNIAQSLMELQKGQLQLLVDGDLFKATLIFPGA